MINEELLFRYYLIGFLVNQLKYGIIAAIIISSLLFSLYHIHCWFSFKNLRILMLNLIYSFLLGLYNSYVVIILGIFPCILIHFGLALSLYYDLYKKYYEQ
jgi:membrane protease YdiL (CAAX protease family)